jgi:hypothetical protein
MDGPNDSKNVAELEMLLIPKLTIEQLCRFWKKVDSCNPDECWLWLGRRTYDGYGVFWIAPHHYRATRIMLALQGKQSNELQACHSCDNPSCVNPAHLSFQTHAENQQDKIRAGTDPKGSRHPRSKLTELDIPIIRNLVLKLGRIPIAKLFDVTPENISTIKYNKSWRHVVGIATDEEVKQYLDYEHTIPR